MPAGIDHRFDGENHARFKPHACAGVAVMQDCRRAMECLSKTVPGEITDDGKAVRFGMFLNGMADIAERVARPCGIYTTHQAVIGDLGQTAV